METRLLNARRPPAPPRAGMTLLEVLAAVTILGIVLVVLMGGITQCMSAFTATSMIGKLQTALDRAEAAHPLIVRGDDSSWDPTSDTDLNVSDTIAIETRNGKEEFKFERECEDDDDEDGLYVVRTTIRHGDGGPGRELTVFQYIFFQGNETAK